jgi:hypothetical protein
MPPGAEEYQDSPFNFGNNGNNYDYGPASSTPGMPSEPMGMPNYSEEQIAEFSK